MRKPGRHAPGTVIGDTGTTASAHAGFFAGSTTQYSLVVGLFTSAQNTSSSESLAMLGGGRENQQPRIFGEGVQALGVAAFDLAGDRLCARKSEPPGDIRSPPGARQFEQREWVPVTLGDDLVADRGV